MKKISKTEFLIRAIKMAGMRKLYNVTTQATAIEDGLQVVASSPFLENLEEAIEWGFKREPDKRWCIDNIHYAVWRVRIK